jgi:hypothetical protein
VDYDFYFFKKKNSLLEDQKFETWLLYSPKIKDVFVNTQEKNESLGELNEVSHFSFLLERFVYRT